MPTVRRHLSWKLLPLALLTLSALGVAAGWIPDNAAAESRAVDVDAVEVTLGALRDAPSAELGRRVSFRIQHRALADTWNPYVTRFGPTDWVAIEAWPDEAFVWQPDVHADPTSRLFVRRGSPLLPLLRAARRLDRLAVVGVVRETFLGEPWIEIESAEPLEERVSEGTVLHVVRAQAFVNKGQWRLALEQLDRAQAGPLPAHAVAELERLRRRCENARANAAARAARR